MRHPYNPHGFVLMDWSAIAMLLIGAFGVITTSRWLTCRLCGLSEGRLYRWSSFWPLIMFLAWCLLPHGGGLHYILGPGIAVAFGLAFSIANLRMRSWYSRGLGVAFGLLHGFLLCALFRELQMYERYLD
jgi:hypothetical protein